MNCWHSVRNRGTPVGEDRAWMDAKPVGNELL